MTLSEQQDRVKELYNNGTLTETKFVSFYKALEKLKDTARDEIISANEEN